MERELKIDSEVIKFAVMLGSNIVMVCAAYFTLKSDVEEALKTSIENKTRVEMVEKHNQRQDLETVAFRTEMQSRVANIEKLTTDIHNAVIGN
jgi:hypothetical protein